MNPAGTPTRLGTGTYRIDAAAVLDASMAPVAFAPGALLIEVSGGRCCVLAVGRPAEVDRHPGSPGAVRIDRTGHILTPAFVNAHTHLDLTHIGPQLPSSFPDFVSLVRSRRHSDPAAIRESVIEGARLSLAGGVAAVGDIGGAVRGGASIEPFLALRDSPLAGVSFLEFFAVGGPIPRALELMNSVTDRAIGLEPCAVRFGLQPHAPYSVAPAGYRQAFGRAARDGLPLATHLAESPEEREFIAFASGPQRMLLESLGLWSEALLGEYGQGRSSVAHMAPVLRDRAAGQPILLVHLNDLSDADVDLLAAMNEASPIHAAYCPRASEFFHAPEAFGPHRYRKLLAAGINVCLGTDSIVNLPPEHATGEAARISPLDDARMLFLRDGTDPGVLLEMLTVRGAKALGLDPAAFSFAPRSTPIGVCAIDIPPARPLDARSLWKLVLDSSARPSLHQFG